MDEELQVMLYYERQCNITQRNVITCLLKDVYLHYLVCMYFSVCVRMCECVRDIFMLTLFTQDSIMVAPVSCVKFIYTLPCLRSAVCQTRLSSAQPLLLVWFRLHNSQWQRRPSNSLSFRAVFNICSGCIVC